MTLKQTYQDSQKEFDYEFSDIGGRHSDVLKGRFKSHNTQTYNRLLDSFVELVEGEKVPSKMSENFEIRDAHNKALDTLLQKIREQRI